MSLSVSIPRNAFKVVYAECDEYFDDAIDSIRSTAQARYPSLQRCNTWLAYEDRAILENPYCYIVVSVYCGLVALSVVVKNSNKASLAWAERFDADHFVEYFGDRLISKGLFSNGEQVFIRANNPRDNISSNGSRW